MNTELESTLQLLRKGSLIMHKNLAKLSGMAVQAFDQVTTRPGLSVPVLVWAAARLAHKTGVSREVFDEFVERAWMYSLERDSDKNGW